MQERALGPGHPQVATTLNNLGVLYRQQGRYAEAEAAHRRALAIREGALGKNHPEVATSLSNLAALYYVQGRQAEAEALRERALAIERRSSR
jgi:Flp pilus assembly protein TadD